MGNEKTKSETPRSSHSVQIFVLCMKNEENRQQRFSWAISSALIIEVVGVVVVISSWSAHERCCGQALDDGSTWRKTCALSGALPRLPRNVANDNNIGSETTVKNNIELFRKPIRWQKTIA
jgi:hypothetical protein